MPTKDELKEQNEELLEENKELLEANDELLEENKELKSTVALLEQDETAPVVRSTKKLYWPHEVDLSTGMEPSAFGIKLTKDEEGNWYGMVPEDRVEAELGRSGKAFVKELLEPEEGEE